jgi:hypothetical protein
MELEFKEADGRKVALRGMSNDAPRIFQLNGWRVFSDMGM